MKYLPILLLLSACQPPQPDPIVKVDCSKEPTAAETLITTLAVLKGASFYPTECK